MRSRYFFQVIIKLSRKTIPGGIQEAIYYVYRALHCFHKLVNRVFLVLCLSLCKAIDALNSISHIPLRRIAERPATVRTGLTSAVS